MDPEPDIDADTVALRAACRFCEDICPGCEQLPEPPEDQ